MRFREQYATTNLAVASNQCLVASARIHNLTPRPMWDVAGAMMYVNRNPKNSTKLWRT